MIFYDCYGNEHQFDLSNPIGGGECGKAYQYTPEWVLKQYNNTCSANSRIKKRNI